jgi:putative hydrolase of the HAD superfamily
MDIRAVLFDLDDTLVAFDSVTEQSWRKACAEYCSARAGVDAEALRTAIAAESAWYWSDTERHRIGRKDMLAARKTVVEKAFRKMGLPIREAYGLAEDYSRIRLKNMYVLPGAEAALSWLASRGFSLALLTNGDAREQRHKIQRFGLAKYFGAILIEGELGFGKPDPRVYRLALCGLGAAAERTVMVGDNLEWDVSAPKRLGIKSAWIDRGGLGAPLGLEEAPDWIIKDISEFLDVLGVSRA